MKNIITTYLPSLRITIYTLVMVLISLNLFAQNSYPVRDSLWHESGVIKSPMMKVPCRGLVNPPSLDPKWIPVLSHEEIKTENKSPDNALIQEIKAEKQKIKDAAETQRQPGSESTQGTSSVSPVMGTNFFGNPCIGLTPLDNIVAVSNGGIIVSMDNTLIEILDTSGNYLYPNPYYQNVNTIMGQSYNVCDEFVLYDPYTDRFIACAIEAAANSSNTALCIAFSKTNNPATGGWYTYALNGDPFSQGLWIDFPRMAISNGELFISGNLFNNSDVFSGGAALWQINKAGGYNGDSLTCITWNGFQANIYAPYPLSNGQGLVDPPGIYMVASYPKGGNQHILYHISDSIGGNPAMTNKVIATAAYSPGGNSSQLGTNVLLNTNDCRILSGFYLNGIAHFVLHSDYNNSGYCGINYNRVNVSNGSITSTMLGTSGFDDAYPSVASFGTSPTDKSVVIGFGRSGSSIYPEMRAVICDDGMNWSSSILLQAGTANVTYNGLDPERWGDYTGISRVYNSPAMPKAWIAGCYGDNLEGHNSHWDTWLAEIHGSSDVGINELGRNGMNAMYVYPNPVVSFFRLEFTLPAVSDIYINIYDVHGRLIQNLYNGHAQEGDNIFSFNKANLKAGIYFLVIKNDSAIIKNEKIVVAE